MIQIKDIKESEADLYHNDIFICKVKKLLNLNDIRIQIAERMLSDYYLIFEGKRINILQNGELSNWPKGFFDKEEDQLRKLHNLSREWKQRLKDKQQ